MTDSDNWSRYLQFGFLVSPASDDHLMFSFDSWSKLRNVRISYQRNEMVTEASLSIQYWNKKVYLHTSGWRLPMNPLLFPIERNLNKSGRKRLNGEWRPHARVASTSITGKNYGLAQVMNSKSKVAPSCPFPRRRLLTLIQLTRCRCRTRWLIKKSMACGEHPKELMDRPELCYLPFDEFNANITRSMWEALCSRWLLFWSNPFEYFALLSLQWSRFHPKFDRK